ncbi:hypothetical protein CYMTET_56984 [Cymbomonas tetramitiformis]|uniref:C3H1-type domain-containing protein n=1 Tax=Cymbomonas tetramitiformis TaxID=36881 RepID=A0AAE0BB30_9CHLO|nr:hypothetical protein CYMTET_56984 [Cymbomonas tetramitiformis]
MCEKWKAKVRKHTADKESESGAVGAAEHTGKSVIVAAEDFGTQARPEIEGAQSFPAQLLDAVLRGANFEVAEEGEAQIDLELPERASAFFEDLGSVVKDLKKEFVEVQDRAETAGSAGKENNKRLAQFEMKERAKSKVRKHMVEGPDGAIITQVVPRLSRSDWVDQAWEQYDGICSDEDRNTHKEYVTWILSLDERFAWVDVYDFDTEVREHAREGNLTSLKPSELLYRLDMKAFKEKEAPFVGGRGADAWNRWPKNPRTDSRKGGKHGKDRKGQRVKYCDFFSAEGKQCTRRVCNFAHACSKCDGKHAAHECPQS